MKASNLNLSLYSYGTLQHLLFLINGTLPPVSKEEYISRLQHAINVLEITCLESGLSDFDSFSWRVSREYNFKILKDIELGYKNWKFLDKCIDSTAWTYAQKMVQPKKQPNPTQNSRGGGQNANQKLCTTYNTFRKEGCYFEHNNPGESCVFLHHCSNCRQRGFPGRKHKAIDCREEGFNQNSNSNPPNSNVTSVSSNPAVTSV